MFLLWVSTQYRRALRPRKLRFGNADLRPISTRLTSAPPYISRTAYNPFGSASNIWTPGFGRRGSVTSAVYAQIVSHQLLLQERQEFADGFGMRGKSCAHVEGRAFLQLDYGCGGGLPESSTNTSKKEPIPVVQGEPGIRVTVAALRSGVYPSMLPSCELVT